jgi:hypothetical protein
MQTWNMTNSVPGAVGRTAAGLSAQLFIANSLIVEAPRAYAALEQPRAEKDTKKAKPSKKDATKPPFVPKWCWSHGKCAHSSNECTKPAAGHQEAATIDNKMGSTTPFANPRFQN